MAYISKITIKQTAKGSDYKAVTLDSFVKGKNSFNIFKFHSRYGDVTEGMALPEEDFGFSPDGKYLELLDPDKGVKKGYGNNPQPSNDKIDQLLAGMKIVDKKLDQVLNWIASKPPF